jgi:hypothetical protein
MKKVLDTINEDLYKGASARGSAPPHKETTMAYKIHLLVSVKGKTACNSNAVGNGKMIFNSRKAMEFIPDSYKVNPDDFRAAPASDRCAHCSDKFLETMNRRRKMNGKPLYANVWTKELA